LRQQSTPLPTSFNGLAALQRLNPQKYLKPQAILYSSNKKLLEKRRLRLIWLRFRSPHIKRQLNKAARELKQLPSDNYNGSFQRYMQNLSPTTSTDCSLWKAVKRIEHIPSSSSALQTDQGT
jgi:hypothetical protein